MKLETSTIISILYASLLTVFLIVTGFIATKRLHQTEFKKKNDSSIKKWDDLKITKQIQEWLKLVYKLRSIYLSGLIHIYDTATAYEQWTWDESSNKKYPNSRLSMLGLAISSLIAFSIYRIISSFLVYKYTKKPLRFITQLLDLDLFRAIHIAHYLERESVIDLQRWLQKLEAIFESAPQALLQIVFLTLSDDNIKLSRNSIIITSSLILSLISIAQRFTNDDKVFFENNKGALANIKWKNLLYVTYIGLYPMFYVVYFIHSSWNKECISNEFLERYLFRITDVFSRIMILSLVWIVFPKGGYCLMALLSTESITILIWVIYTEEYNKLQLLVATYFAEFVEIEENESNLNKTKYLESTKLRSAK